MRTEAAKRQIRAAVKAGSGPLWALVERWERRRDDDRAAGRNYTGPDRTARVLALAARAAARDQAAAELADVLRTIEGGEG
jgi:hypothetical protein